MADAVNAGPSVHVRPEPLREEPPVDRYCDLVFSGGVASGVVFPWAAVELARHFRFRSLGGTSVGAMTAAITAAAEYGRRHGSRDGFELLRQLPIELAKPPKETRTERPITTLESLFQPAPAGRRLFRLFSEAVDALYADAKGKVASRGGGWFKRIVCALRAVTRVYGLNWLLCFAVWATGLAVAATVCCAIFLLWLAVVERCHGMGPCLPEYLAGGTLVGVAVSVGLWTCLGRRLWTMLRDDLREGVLLNDLGLCRGSSTERDRDGQPVPALVDWLHDGIQRAAGLTVDDPPLTFEELWHAPLWPGGDRPPAHGADAPDLHSINLQMITTNVTHGRPIRLPLPDDEVHLYYDPLDWERFFPPSVMAALERTSEAYRPMSWSDPDRKTLTPGETRLRSLPRAALPIVVAARLSLSFPLLFSAVPLYAVDHEPKKEEGNLQRRLRRCRFSDGGFCSNFPVHFFDAALPSRPTFGIWLHKRNRYRRDQPVWLPKYPGEGRGDSWQRFEPEDQEGPSDDGRQPDPGPSTLLQFLYAAIDTSRTWPDWTALRLPHVRNRVARIGMKSEEDGELNFRMPGQRILELAEYGIEAGKTFCDRFAPKRDKGSEAIRTAWREHLYIRLEALLQGSSDLLRGFGRTAASRRHTAPIRELLDLWSRDGAVRTNSHLGKLTVEQAVELRAIVDAIERLEDDLVQRPEMPYPPSPRPELRLRPTV